MKVITVTLVVATAIGLAVKYIADFSAGWTMLAILIGVPALGLLVTIDDDLPGGFSNPDGKTPPPWSYREFWGELAVRGSLGGVGFAADFGWVTAEALAAWAVVFCGTTLGVAVMRHPIRSEA